MSYTDPEPYGPGSMYAGQAAKSAQQMQNYRQSNNGASVGETDPNSHFLKHDTASLELVEKPLQHRHGATHKF